MPEARRQRLSRPHDPRRGLLEERRRAAPNIWRRVARLGLAGRRFAGRGRVSSSSAAAAVEHDHRRRERGASVLLRAPRAELRGGRGGARTRDRAEISPVGPGFCIWPSRGRCQQSNAAKISSKRCSHGRDRLASQVRQRPFADDLDVEADAAGAILLACSLLYRVGTGGGQSLARACADRAETVGPFCALREDEVGRGRRADHPRVTRGDAAVATRIIRRGSTRGDAAVGGPDRTPAVPRRENNRKTVVARAGARPASAAAGRGSARPPRGPATPSSCPSSP